uniref:Uncharacterized protein n=1 Tax=Anopheles maculatus TaxID=74869 RepID=A0A182TAD5_9DIPT
MALSLVSSGGKKFLQPSHRQLVQCAQIEIERCTRDFVTSGRGNHLHHSLQFRIVLQAPTPGWHELAPVSSGAEPPPPPIDCLNVSRRGVPLPDASSFFGIFDGGSIKLFDEAGGEGGEGLCRSLEKPVVVVAVGGSANPTSFTGNKSAILLFDASESFSFGNVEGVRLVSPPPPPVAVSESFEFSSPLPAGAVSMGVLVDFAPCDTPSRPAADDPEKRWPLAEAFSRSCPLGFADESLLPVLSSCAEALLELLVLLPELEDDFALSAPFDPSPEPETKAADDPPLAPDTDFLPSLFGLECLCLDEEDDLSFSFDTELEDADIDDEEVLLEAFGSVVLESDDDF